MYASDIGYALFRFPSIANLADRTANHPGERLACEPLYDFS